MKVDYCMVVNVCIDHEDDAPWNEKTIESFFNAILNRYDIDVEYFELADRIERK